MTDGIYDAYRFSYPNVGNIVRNPKATIARYHFDAEYRALVLNGLSAMRWLATLIPNELREQTR